MANEFLGETVAEVFVCRVVAQIRKRQDDEPRLRRLRRSDPAAGPIECRNEPIAAAGQCLDESRMLGIVTKSRAQAFDRGVQCVLEVDERAVGPEPALKFFAGNDIAWPLKHHAEDLARLLLKANPLRGRAQLTRAHIQFEVREAE